MSWSFGPAHRWRVVIPLAIAILALVPFDHRVSGAILVAIGIASVVLHHVVASARIRLDDKKITVRPYGFLGRRRELGLSDLVGVRVVEDPHLWMAVALGSGEVLALGPWRGGKRRREKLQDLERELGERIEAQRGSDRY